MGCGLGVGLGRERRWFMSELTFFLGGWHMLMSVVRTGSLEATAGSQIPSGLVFEAALDLIPSPQ